jgi:hypothetical protein
MLKQLEISTTKLPHTAIKEYGVYIVISHIFKNKVSDVIILNSVQLEIIYSPKLWLDTKIFVCRLHTLHTHTLMYIVHVLSALINLRLLMDLIENTQKYNKIYSLLLSIYLVANTVEVMCKYCITAFGCNMTYSKPCQSNVQTFMYCFECYSFHNHTTVEEWVLRNITHFLCNLQYTDKI